MGPSPHETESVDLRRALALLLLALLAPPPAVANPQGGSVVAGEAQIDHQGRHTHIEAGDRSIIEWQSFNIDRHESVEFVQPGAWATVLNRVTTADPTHIMGRLSANGQVYIVNPYGVYLGNTAVVDVARLVAGAGTLSNQDFLSGVDRFTELNGRIENHGFLSADAVTLVGQQVSNHGRIVAHDGDVMMLAGDEVWITEHGSPVLIKLSAPPAELDPQAGAAVSNHGRIEAGRGRARLAAGDWISLAVHNTGAVRAREIALEGGEGSIVEVAGSLDASDTTAGGTGGSIEVLGDHVRLRGARLDASGDAGGGTVLVGGEAHGEGERRSARDTYVSPASRIRADALRRGDGGEIVVWADEATYAYGELSAQGGTESGDGGFVETSGGHLDVRRAPDLSAPAGHGGEWLIDPTNVVITDQAGGLDDELEFASPLFVNQVRPPSDGSTTAMLGTAVLVDALAQGASVTVTTRTQDDAGSSSADVGNITVASEIVIEAGDAILEGTEATLGLRAANHITIDERIANENENLTLSVGIQANDPFQPDNDINVGDVDINAPIETGGGFIDAQGVNTTVGEAAVLDTGGGSLSLFGGMVLNETLGPITVPGSVTLKGDAVTSGGDVQIDALGGSALVQAKISTGGESVNGDVRITALDTGAGTSAIEIGDTAEIETGGGRIDISGNVTQIDVSGPIKSGGGDVVIVANPDTTSMPEVNVTISGAIETEGGNVIAWSTADGAQVEIGGPIKTTGGTEDLAGRVSIGFDPDFTNEPAADVRLTGTIEAKGAANLRGRNVSVESGADITASEIQLQAGQANSDGILLLDSAQTGLTLAADKIFLENIGVTETEQAIVVNQTRFTSSADPSAPPTELAFVQGPNIVDSALPDASRFGGGSPSGMDYTIDSTQGMIVIETGSKVTGTNLHLLSAGTFTTADNIKAKLSPSSIELVSGEALEVTKQLAEFIQPVPSGVEGEATTITLHAGASGAGDLTFESTADLALTADEITLRAGVGPDGGFQEVEAFVDAANDTVEMSPRFAKPAGSDIPDSPLKFTMQQDGELTADLVPAPEQFTGGTADIDYALRSDLDSIVIDSDLTSKLGGTDLTLLTSEPFLVTGEQSPISVTKAQVGGVGNFEVTQEVLDALFKDVPLGELTLSAGIREPGGETRLGTLSFAETTPDVPDDPGVTVSAQKIKLMANEVQGTTNSPVFQGTDPGTNPDRFEINQLGALVDTTNVPAASQFGKGDVEGLDYILHSDAVVDLSDATRYTRSDLTVTSLVQANFTDVVTKIGDRAGPLTLDATAPVISIAESSGKNLFFSTRTTLTADRVELRATPATLEDARVIANRGRLELILNEDNDPDVDPTLIIRQTGTVLGVDLPEDTQFSGAPPSDLTYTLISTLGQIDLRSFDLEVDGTDKVAGSDLNLVAETPELFPGRSGVAIHFPETKLVLDSLEASTSGDFLVSRNADIETKGPIRLVAGLRADAMTGIGGDLTFERGVKLSTGVGSEDSRITLAARGGVVNGRWLRPEFATERLSIDQDDPLSDIRHLPLPEQINMGASLAEFTIDSPGGAVTIERANRFAGGTSVLEISAPEIIFADVGTLSFPETTTFAAESLTLRAGERIDGAADDGLRFDLFAPREVVSGGEIISAPAEFVFEQGEALDGDALPELSQFLKNEPIHYTVRSDESIMVGDTFVDRVVGTTLSLEGKSVTLAADLTLESPVQVPVTLPDGTELPAASLAVTSDEIRIEANEIVTGGDQVYDGNVILAAVGAPPMPPDPNAPINPTRLTGGNITFGSAEGTTTLEADLAGQNSLLITAEGQVTFYGDVGTTSRLDQLEIDLSQGSGTVRFARSDALQQVVHANDILLNPNGRPPTSQATIFRNQDNADPETAEQTPILFQGDLELIADESAMGRFEMGSGEMLSVPGTLEIRAEGGTAQVGDLTAEEIVVRASAIQIVRRLSTDLLLSDGRFVKSPSTAIVGNRIRFEDPTGEAIAAVGVVGDGDSPIFGVPDPFDPPAFLAQLPPQNQFPVFAIDAAFQPVGASALGLGGAALSLTPLGPSRALYAEALWTRSPVPEVARPADAKRLDPSPLLKIGIAPRATTAAEFRSWLDGAAIYDDVAIGVARRRATQRGDLLLEETPGGEPAAPVIVAVAEPRLQGDETERALYFYDRVLGPERENASRIRSVLQAAVDDYIATTGMRRVVGFELRRFIRNRPSSQFEAYQVLEDLDVLFRYHRRSGLAPAEYELIEAQWLVEMKPEGVSLEQFGQAIHPSRYVRGSDILDIFGD